MSDSSSQDNSVPLDLLVSVVYLQDEAPAPAPATATNSNSDSESGSGRDSHEIDPNELVHLAQRFAGYIQDSNPDIDLGEMGLENISEPRHVPPWLVEMIMLHQIGRGSLSVPSVPSWNAESRVEVDSSFARSISPLSLGSALTEAEDPYLPSHARAQARGRRVERDSHLSADTHPSFLPNSEETQRALTHGIPESIIQRARESEGGERPTSSAILRAAREIGRENRREMGISYRSQDPSVEGESSRGRGLQVPVPGVSPASGAPYTTSRSPAPPRLTLTPLPLVRSRARSASKSSNGSHVPSPLSREVFAGDIDDMHGDNAEGAEAE